MGWGFVEGFCRFAKMRRWIITVEDTLQCTTEKLRTSRIDGIAGLIHTSELIDHIVENQLPAVNLTRDRAMDLMSSILVDDYQAGRLAADYLMSRGFMHFGYLGTVEWPYARQRGEGFINRLSEAGHGERCHWIERESLGLDLENLTDKPTNLETVDWLLNLPKPIGIFTMQDQVGLSLATICQIVGIRVPEELAILGVHNAQINCELASPALSSVDTSVVQRGFLAATMLDKQFRGMSNGIETVVLPPVGVVTRGSTDVVAMDDPIVVEAIHYIRDHAHEGIDVNDVVNALTVSRRALERRFKATLKRTPMEEIHRLKLNNALELLATTTLPMSNLASQSGYGRQDRMAKAVREATGLSPTAYRRKFQGH